MLPSRRKIILSAVFSTALFQAGVAPVSAVDRSWATGDGTWSATSGANWSPTGNPNSGDLVRIGDLATANDAVVEVSFPNAEGEGGGTLLPSNGANVVIGDIANNANDRLRISGLVELRGSSGIWLRGMATPGFGDSPDTLNSRIVAAFAGDELAMRGGRLGLHSTSAGGLRLDLRVGSTLTGWGTIDFDAPYDSNDAAAHNRGTITVGNFGTEPGAIVPPFGEPTARTLTLNVPFGYFAISIDTDVVVNIQRNATLDINGAVKAPVTAPLNLAANATLAISEPWVWGGEINVNSGATTAGGSALPAAPARIAGGALRIDTAEIVLDQADEHLIFDAIFDGELGTFGSSVIRNSGKITFNNIATIDDRIDFQMNGPNASLEVNANVTITKPDFNLDGAGTATNVLTIGDAGRLDLDLGTGGDFSLHGTVEINGGVFDINTPLNLFTLPAGGRLFAGGTSEGRIIGAGETFGVGGLIDVAAGARLEIDPGAGIQFSSSSQINVAAGGDLDLDSPSVIYSSSTSTFNGGGIFRPGNALYNADTVFNVATVDFDDGTQTLAGGSDLTINADAIETGSASDGFDGTLAISDGSLLTVNINGGGSWDMEGMLNYSGDAGFNTFLAGSTLDLEGTMNVAGKGITAAQIHIMPSGSVNLASATDELQINSFTTLLMSGGQITGNGKLSSAFGDVSGFGTIAANVEFFSVSGSIRAANGGTLTLSGDILDVGTLGTADDLSTLNILKPWNTSVATKVDLKGGSLIGATITGGGDVPITGFGLITARVINNTAITAKGAGTLVVERATGNDNDWDGATETGLLMADGGNLTIRDTLSFPFDGQVQVETGNTVFAEGFELEFKPSSRLTLNGGTYRSTSTTHIHGSVEAGGGFTSTMRIEGTALFEATSDTTVVGDLQLDNVTTSVAAGAQITGPGQLINLPTRRLLLSDGVDIDTKIVNGGTLEVAGFGVGSATVDGYSQTSDGTAIFDLSGTSAGESDRLNVDGALELDGEIGLFLSGTYVPALGDMIDIITAASVSGMFSLIDQAPGMPTGLFFDVVYSPTLVQLMVVDSLPDADVDDDGDVDGADFLIIQRTNPSLIPLWKANFGMGVAALTNSQSVPEPSGAALLSLCVVVSIRGRRNR